MRQYFKIMLCLGVILLTPILTSNAQSMIDICKTKYALQSLSNEDILMKTSDGKFNIIAGPEEGWYSIATEIEDSNMKKSTVYMLLGGKRNLREFYKNFDGFVGLGEYGAGCVLSTAELYMLVIKGTAENGKIKLAFYDVNENYLGSSSAYAREELEEIFGFALRSIEGELFTEKTKDGKELLSLNRKGMHTNPNFAIDITGQEKEIFSKIDRYLIMSDFGYKKDVANSIGTYKDQLTGEEFRVSVVAETRKTTIGRSGDFKIKFRNNEDTYMSDSFTSIDDVRYLFY